MSKILDENFNFDAAPNSELIGQSLDAMFDVSVKQREQATEREERFRRALATIQKTDPSGEKTPSGIIGTRIPVAIYARYSDDQQNPLSIDDQFAECRRYCERMGYEPIIFASDAAKTGQSFAGRDGWATVMKAVEDGMVAIIVCESLDRAARDPVDLLLVMESLRRTGAALDTPSTGKASELQGLLHAIYNSLFRTGLVQKVRRGMIGAVERGRHPGGNVFGLKKVRGKTEEEDDYFPDEDQAKIVFRVMWEIGVLERSYAEIAYDLNRENIPAPRGGLWSAQNFVKSKSELGGFATNPRCIGVVQWNKASYPLNRETNTHATQINPRSEWIIGYNANHQFIPIWLYQKVQAVVASRRTGTGGPKASVPRRLLTGQLKCGVCRTGTMRIIAADKYGRDRVGCAVYSVRGDCNHGRTYYLDIIEKMVVTGLRDFLSSPELVAAQFEEASEEINRIRKDLEAERKAIEAEVDGLQPITADLVAKMAGAGIDDGMVRHIVDRELKPIYEKQEGLRARISEIGKLLSSDQLQISKIETEAGAMADLEKMLEETKGRNLPRDLINSLQALAGKVYLVPDPESRHFDLRIEGHFDALVGENYLGPLAVLNSLEYKAGQMGGSRHFDKLTIGKQFVLNLTSRAMLRETELPGVKQRRIDNLGSRTRDPKALNLRVLDAAEQLDPQ